jgi:peptide/nickel transport system permease protein
MQLALTAAHRTGRALLVVAGVAVVVFIVTHLVGDPARLVLPLDASHAQYVHMRHELGTDKPLSTQFFEYFSHVLRGNFGTSFWFQTPVLPLVLSRVPATLALGAAAVGLGIIFGVPAGFLAAIKADTAVDRFISSLSVLGVSIANFWLALILILVFAVQLRWLPTSGYGWRNLVLPALAAAAYPFGQLSQIARASMLEELEKPYMLAARARGLSVTAAVMTHATRNALIPIITIAGFEFGRVVAGFLIVIEIIFSWPGVGNLMFVALSHQDFPLIQACVLVIAVLVVVTNLSVDLLYSVIDPRLRKARR